MTLDTHNIGWSKSIRQCLREFGLETDFAVIKTYTHRQWARTVKEKIKTYNKNRLINECHKMENGKKIRKTKTEHIVDKITSNDYEIEPCPTLIQCTKQETTTLTIARFHMLECGVNYRGTLRDTCQECKVIDTEDHRLNYCKKYASTNRYAQTEKVQFEDIYSNDINVVKRAIKAIEQVWDTKSAHGTMRN